MNKKDIMIALFVSIGSILHATEDSTIVKWSLQQCITQGIEQNYQLQIQREYQTVSDRNATIGNAGYLPSLDLNAGYSGQYNSSDSEKEDGTTETRNGELNQQYNAGLNLSWTIFDGLKMQASYAKLKELKSMGEVKTRIQIDNTAAGIAAGYYQLIRQKIKLRNLKAALDLSKERLRIVEERYHIGSSSRLELQQAKVDYNADNALHLKQTEVVYTARILLNELMGLDNVNQNTDVANEEIHLAPMVNKEELWQRTLSANLSLLNAEKSRQLSIEDLRIARSRNYPYLKLNAGYGYNGNRYEVGPTIQRDQLGLNYGATIGLNIFDGLNRQREQRNAKTQIRIAELEKQSLELALKADMSNLWMAYTNNLMLLRQECQNVETAKEYLEIAMERYKLGDLSGIELREAQNSLLAAEERLSTAEYETKVCEISLMQLSGDILPFLYQD
ncbi:MAG: TolC family protein [Bacteroidales bacterium]